MFVLTAAFGAASACGGPVARTQEEEQGGGPSMPGCPALELGFALLRGGPGFVRLDEDDADRSAPSGVLGTTAFVVGTLTPLDV